MPLMKENRFERLENYFGNLPRTGSVTMTFEELFERCGEISPAYIHLKHMGGNGHYAFQNHLLRKGWLVESVDYDARTITFVPCAPVNVYTKI